MSVPLDLEYVAADESITNEEIVRAFVSLMKAMEARGIVRTKNIPGDLSEHYAVQAYAGRLELADPNEPSFDAKGRGRRALRYSIKSVGPGTKQTGVNPTGSGPSIRRASIRRGRQSDEVRAKHVRPADGDGVTHAKEFELKPVRRVRHAHRRRFVNLGGGGDGFPEHGVKALQTACGPSYLDGL